MSLLFTDNTPQHGDTAYAAAVAAQSTANQATNTADQASTDAANALTASQNAQSLADGKAVIYYQSSAPTTASLKDLWVDSDNGYVSIYDDLGDGNGPHWVGARDQGISQALTDAAQANNTANGAASTAATKITTFYAASTATPTASATGDLWVVTDNKNQLKRWDGSTWVDVRDVTIADAQGTASSKSFLYWQSAMPVTSSSLLKYGDLWVDNSNGNKIYNWNGSAWVYMGLSSTALTATARDLGAITTYVQSTTPTGTLKAGDIWLDTTTSANTLRRYDGAGNWVQFQDSGISQALTTAQSKNKVLAQTSAPATAALGDLWIDTTSNLNIVKVCTAVGPPPTFTPYQDATKNRSTASSTAPSSPSPIVGDIWINTTDNVVRIYDGTTPWALYQDKAIPTLQTTVGNKVTTYAQTSQPSTTGRTLGDMWIDTTPANGNRISVWANPGPAWTLTQFNAAALSATARSLGGVTTYIQNSVPSGGTYYAGDLWMDTTATTGQMHQYNGTNWTTQVWSDPSLAAAANNALTTAQAKAKVSTGTSAPASPSTNDLWIDTGNGNTIKVWSGSSWLPYNDATKNKSSAGSTAPASPITGDLWVDTSTNIVKIWNGSTWNPYQDQAIPALQTGKTTTYYQTSAPPTTNRVTGDMWVDTTVGNGYRISVWNGSWTLSQFTAAALNTNARALGGLNTYVQGTAPSGTLFVGDLWMDNTAGTGTMHQWNGTNWTSVTWSDPGLAAAIAAKNKVTAQASAPSSPATGDLWIDTTNNNVIKIWSGSAWNPYSDKTKNNTTVGTTQPANPILGDVWIDTTGGNNYLKVYNGTSFIYYQNADIAAANNLAASKNHTYNQSSAPTAPSQGFLAGDIWVNSTNGLISYWNPGKAGGAGWSQTPIDAGALVSTLVLSSRVVAGSATGTHAEMASDGFHVYKADPNTPSNPPIEVARMGVASTNDYFAIVDAGGNTLASVTDDGTVNGTGANFDGLFDNNNDGVPDYGVTIYGLDFSDHIADLPQGILAYGIRNTRLSAYTTTEAPFQELQATMYPNRMYRVMTGPLTVQCNTAGGQAITRLRYTIDGTTPGITSPLGSTSNAVTCTTAAAWYGSPGLARYFSVTTQTDFRALLTIGPGSSSYAVNLIGNDGTGGMSMWIEDVGPAIGDTGIDRTGGTPPPLKKTYVSVWQASATEGYNGSGGARTDTTDMVQGQDPSGFNGNGWGSAVFAGANSTGGETGKTIATALSGATVQKVEVYLYANHWYYNAGGTAVIRNSNSTSLINTVPAGTSVNVGGWAANTGRWVDITSIAGAATRGVTIGQGPTTSYTYYGRFNGNTTGSGVAALRFTYVK